MDIVSKEKIKVADCESLTVDYNLAYISINAVATFSITLKKESNEERGSSSEEKESKSAKTEKITYGSVVSVSYHRIAFMSIV